MRKINSLEDVQLVINDLLNFKSRLETGAQNFKGNRAMNVGAGSLDSDAATMGQLNDAVNSIQIPKSADIQHYKTITWSLSGTPDVNAILPPFCIVNSQLVCYPHTYWITVNTSGTTELDVDLLLNGVSILSKDNLLVLKKNETGPNTLSSFVPNGVKFGVGGILVPKITKVGGQSGITIGLVVRRSEKVSF